eukprot:3065494-Ditylum_brightwellii.AAC.1
MSTVAAIFIAAATVVAVRGDTTWPVTILMVMHEERVAYDMDVFHQGSLYLRVIAEKEWIEQWLEEYYHYHHY